MVVCCIVGRIAGCVVCCRHDQRRQIPRNVDDQQFFVRPRFLSFWAPLVGHSIGHDTSWHSTAQCPSMVAQQRRRASRKCLVHVETLHGVDLFIVFFVDLFVALLSLNV